MTREHAYRPAFKELLESAETGLTATNEPKRMTDVGAPDFMVARGSSRIGYVEAKDICAGTNEVEKVRYAAADERVYINNE